MRLLAIPSAVGLMDGPRMPAGITFAGAAFEDSTVLAAAYAYEAATKHRGTPARICSLQGLPTQRWCT